MITEYWSAFVNEPDSESEEQERRLLSLISDLELFSAQQDLTSKLNIFELIGLDRQEINIPNF